MRTYAMQIVFPVRPGSTTPAPIARVRRIKAATAADATAWLWADYRAKGRAVLAIRSFGTL
jgi:hypothetical protein